MISALMIGAQQRHPLVPPTYAQQCPHLCPAVPTNATQQCHLPVPGSATYLCTAVPPTCAHPPVPTSATNLCPPSVPPISAVYQYPSSVPPISDTSLVLPISAAYPCHLI
ncbi:unnamed protein product, partial [Staurois parvus]